MTSSDKFDEKAKQQSARKEQALPEQSNESSYWVETRWGGSEDMPSVSRTREIISELAVKDHEHPDTWMTHAASEWTLILDQSGSAVLTKVHEEFKKEDARHMLDVNTERALNLWTRFSVGGQEAVWDEPWSVGYPKISDDELKDRRAEAEASLLAMNRTFYDSLGAERADVACKSSECSRGAIEYSVFCRVHHYENLRKCSCPFSH